MTPTTNKHYKDFLLYPTIKKEEVKVYHEACKKLNKLVKKMIKNDGIKS